MKILIIHNHYLEKGGEDEVVKAEARLLEEHGHKVILYEKANEYFTKLPFFKKLGFLWQELNFSKVVYSEIKQIIKTEKPNIAHIHNIFITITPSVYRALKEENVPVVQSLHNYRFFCLKGTFFRKGAVCEKCKNRKFFNAVIRRCSRNSFVFSFFLARLLYKERNLFENIDSYIVTSEFSRDKFIELGLEGEKLHLKTNFLTSEQKGISQDNNYMLFLGRLVDYKGIKTLMSAFKINPAFNLKIIGDGPLAEEVRGVVSSYDNVEWTGRIKKDLVLEAIKNSSFLIFPSECYENMPLVIIESFAFSKPVLASNLGAVKEFVIDGINGILFEPGNALDLSEKISYLFSHNKERIEMGKNANKFYHERFDKEKNYRYLMSIYAGAINSGIGGK